MLSKIIKILMMILFPYSFCYAFDFFTPYKPDVYKPGPYVGLSAGVLTSTSGVPLFYEGGLGTLSAGWGHIWSDYLYWQRTFTAIEGFVGDSFVLKKYGPNDPNQVYNIKTGFTKGIDGIVGYMINPYAFLYGRSGIANTQFNIFTASTGMPVEKAYHTAWRIGGGLQGNIYNHFDVRVEYIFALYPSQTEPVNIGQQFNNIYNFGVVYRFV